MTTDSERREVARRLRHSWVNVPDKNPVRHQLRVLLEIYGAVGLADDDDANALVLFDRLADLIEPGEPKVKCVAEVKVDGEQLEKLVHDAAVELTGINRDALLALADEMERRADLPSLTVAGQDLVFSEFLVGYARRVRKACGEGA